MEDKQKQVKPLFCISRRMVKRLIIHGCFFVLIMTLTIVSQYVQFLDHVGTWIVVGTSYIIMMFEGRKE